MARVHLHRDDCPAALGLVAAVCNRPQPPDGFELTEYGAWVDWDALASSFLSTTEKAALRVAEGLATAERAGGFGRYAGNVENAVVGVLVDTRGVR